MREKAGVVQRALTSAIYGIDAAVNSRNSELQVFSESALQLKKAGPFPDIPVIVISAGKEPSSWHRDNQRDLAGLSPQSRQVIATRSGHIVQDDEPELVIAAIRELVEKSRGK